MEAETEINGRHEWNTLAVTDEDKFLDLLPADGNSTAGGMTREFDKPSHSKSTTGLQEWEIQCK
jgi:hypothetical protein